MRVFADSYYFIAWLNPADAAHVAARRYALHHRPVLVTTRWVLTEVADALSAPVWREVAGRFLSGFEKQPGTVICGDSDTLYFRGLERYRSRSDKQWSLTDGISFVVMEQEGVRDALTGDRHFAQAGFVAVFAE